MLTFRAVDTSAGRGLAGAVTVLIVVFVVVVVVAGGRAGSSAGTVTATVVDVTGGTGDVTTRVATTAAGRTWWDRSRPIGPANTPTARMPEAATEPTLSPSLVKAVSGGVNENMASPHSDIRRTKQFSCWQEYRKIEFGTFKLRRPNESFDLLVTAFSLDCLTLPDLGPIDLVRVAGLAGYGSVSLWVQPPALHAPMLAVPAMAEALLVALSDHRVTVSNLEVFNLSSGDAIEAFEPLIAFGAGLGARSATAIDVGDRRPDIARRLVAFAGLCRRFGIEPLVEPISMGNVRTPRDGLELIEAAGVDARLVIDCAHLIRAGGTAASLRDIPGSSIGRLQLCDGPAELTDGEILVEAMANRLYPGEGDFPLAEVVAAIPSDVMVGLEAPNLARQQAGVPAEERARQALDSARAIVDVVRG